MRLGVHARAAHLEAERKRRARLRSVRPSLAIRSNARKPHYHALRLIEASKSSHRRSKAVHREAWNSRTGAQPEKQAVRRPVDRSRTLRRGGGSTASTAAAKIRAQEKSRALARGFRPDRVLAQRKSKYSFEDSLVPETLKAAGIEPCTVMPLKTRIGLRTTGKQAQGHALRSIHIKAGRTAWDSDGAKPRKGRGPAVA